MGCLMKTRASFSDRIHPLGTMSVCTNCTGKPSNNCVSHVTSITERITEFLLQPHFLVTFLKVVLCEEFKISICELLMITSQSQTSITSLKTLNTTSCHRHLSESYHLSHVSSVHAPACVIK